MTKKANDKINIVWGAPSAGKTTYVKKNKGPGDLVVDLDYILAALTLSENHKDKDNLILPFAFEVRDYIYNILEEDKIIYNRAWIIATLARSLDRELLKNRFDANMIYIDSTEEQCIKNAMNDDSIVDMETQIKIIKKYFKHNKIKNKSKTSEMNYKSKKWKQLRERVLRRDEYMCRECKRYGKVTPANTVHHVLPVKDNPEFKYNSNNLISLCESCHEKMHDKFEQNLTAIGKRWKEKITPLLIK